MQALAREILRDWMRAYDGGTARAFDGIGQNAIVRAADASARLSRPALSGAAEATISEVEAIVSGLTSSSSPRNGWWGRRQTPVPPTQARLNAIAQRLDRDRDSVKRAAIVLGTDRVRIAEAIEGLEGALQLVQAIGSAVDAAAREIRGQDAQRAARLQDVASASLMERRRELLTQLVITRQGLETLDLLMANHAALGAALERARSATLSAFQIAVAAKGAVERSQRWSAQAEALSSTTAATRIEPGVDHAAGTLRDAVTEARSALTALNRNQDR